MFVFLHRVAAPLIVLMRDALFATLLLFPPLMRVALELM
jgi:hypothetical protein